MNKTLINALAAVCGIGVLAVAPLAKAQGMKEAILPLADGTYVPGQVLVKFRAGVTKTVRNQILNEQGAVSSDTILTRAMKDQGEPGLVLMTVGSDIGSAIISLRGNAAVEYAEPNWIYKHAEVSNDTYVTNGSLWGMYGDGSSPTNQYGSQAAEAWSAGHVGSTNVIVGIIDEGVDYTHPDLAANIWSNPYEVVDGRDNDGNGYVDDVRGWDFKSNDNGTFDGGSDDHGTHVAGTIGGVGGNGQGVAGVSWRVKMISCKFLGGSGGTTAAAIKAVDYLTDLKNRHGLNIVASNNSWGGGGFSQALQDAIERHNQANIVFCAAAGNSGYNMETTKSYPACYPNSNIISVAAIASNGTRPSWSNYGSTTCDIAAPGSGIYSTIPGTRYGSMSGTSMATPHVTGAAALYAATRAGSSAASIKSAILGAAVPTASMSGRCVTGGRLNVSGF